ncbi:hypothetical protein [Enterovirga sp. CN4-39]|uniref:hypothetical protein n=1 Tax=Enterovirga sp. CN4-39 TaxID=3400910 RepID=UPI003C09EDBF
MARIRSLITSAHIDIVQRAHDCQGNSKHRLSKGDRRLAVKSDRSWENYCLECGKRILERDAAKIALLLRGIDGAGPVAGEEG